MEDYPLMIQLACVIIVYGVLGIVIAAISESIKEAVRKHRKKKEDAENEHDIRQ